MMKYFDEASVVLMFSCDDISGMNDIKFIFNLFKHQAMNLRWNLKYPQSASLIGGVKRPTVTQVLPNQRSQQQLKCPLGRAPPNDS
jgi:hypothetical protein